LSGLPLHRTQDVSTNEQAHARDRIDAVADLKGTIDQYRNVLRPENVGMIGDLRGLVYGAGQQANAFSQLLQRHAAGTMADLMSTNSDVSLSEFNDPKLSQSQLLSNLLAAKYARVTNPVGVITDKDYIIAKKGLGLEGLLTGATDITEKLKALETAADRVEAIARTRLRDPNERPGVTSPSTKRKYNTIEEYKKAKGIK
jgi:phosphoglycerate-specific signal transduction histidine kinase